MSEPDFENGVRQVLSFDARYDSKAYFFVNDALEYTMKKLGREKLNGKSHHVSGEELLEGILECAVQRFGFLSPEIFEYWGLQNGSDVGSVVYNLIRVRLLSANSDDSIEDFSCMYNLPEILRNRLSMSSVS